MSNGAARRAAQAGVYQQFNNWLAAGGHVANAQAALNSAGGAASSAPRGGNGPATNPGMSVLSGALDFISRPLYSVNNFISEAPNRARSAAVESINKSRKKRDTESGDSEVVTAIDQAKAMGAAAFSSLTGREANLKGALSAGSVPIANVLTSKDGRDGMFATEATKDKKKLGVDIIDQVVKDAGGSKPTWEKDKAATIARGVGGFGLDVGLDPLTYVPLAGVAALIPKGVRASAAISKAGRASEKATAATEKLSAKSAAGEQVPKSLIRQAESAAKSARTAGVRAQNAPSTKRTADRLAAAQANAAQASDSAFVAAAAAKMSAAGRKAAPEISEAAADVAGAGARAISADAPEVVADIATPGARSVSSQALESSAIADRRRASVQRLQSATSPMRSEGLSALRSGAETAKATAADALQGARSEVMDELTMGPTAPDVVEGLRAAMTGTDGPLIEAIANPLEEGSQSLISEFLASARGTKVVDDAAKARAGLVVGRADDVVRQVTQEEDRLIEQILSKNSPERAALTEALGEHTVKELQQLPREQRASAIEALHRFSTNPDKLTPGEVRNAPAVVQQYLVDEFALTPETFDQLARGGDPALLDKALSGTSSNVLSKSSANDLVALSVVAKSLGVSVKELTNDVTTVLRKLTGDLFNPAQVRKLSDGTVLHTDKNGRTYGVIDGSLGKYAMTTASRAISKRVVAALGPLARDPQAKISGLRHGVEGAPSIRESWEAVEKAYFESGMLPGVRIGKGAEAREFPLAPSSIYNAAEEWAAAGGEAAEEMLERLLYNGSTSIRDTSLLEAVSRAALGGADDEIIEALHSANRSGAASVRGKKNPDPLTSNGIHLVSEARGAAEDGLSYIPKKGGGFYRRYAGGRLTAEAVGLVRGIAPRVLEDSATLYAAHVQKSVQDAGKILFRVEEPLREALQRGTGPGVAQLGKTEDLIIEAASELGASRLALQTVAERISDNLPTGAVREASRITQVSEKVAKMAAEGVSPADIARRMEKQDAINLVASHARMDAADLASAARATAASPDALKQAIGDGVDVAAVRSETFTARLLDFFGQRFNVRHRTAVDGFDVYEQVRQGFGISGQDINQAQQAIFDLHRRFNTLVPAFNDFSSRAVAGKGKTAFDLAFSYLQNGARSADVRAFVESGDEAARVVQEAAEALRPLMGKFFDVEGAGTAGDFFWRYTSNPKYLEEAWNHYGLREVSRQPFKDGTPGWDSWKEWDISNPADFLNRYNLAAHRALDAKKTGIDLARTLSERGLASTKPKPGFAQPTQAGRSYLFAGLEDSGLYYDMRVLDAVSEIEKRLGTSRDFGGAFGKAVTDVFDPAQQVWKTAVTVYRLGHHARNLVSNAGISFLAEGGRNLAKSGALAARVLGRNAGSKARGADGSLPLSEVQKMLGDSTMQLHKGGSDVAFTAAGGKISVTFDDIYDAAARRGALRTFMQAEDIVKARTGSVGAKLADKLLLTHTPIGKGVGRASEVMDQHGYVQQALQHFMNNADKIGRRGGYRNADELWDASYKRSGQFHPDSTHMAPFEAKVMRRLIPFYTWFRGTLPSIMSASWQYPGRATAFHKASYGAAQSMGIDAESYANPFPEDADVPDFLRERVFGANFRNPLNGAMFAMNPGFAHVDLASDFFGRGPRVDEETGERTQGVGGNLMENAFRFVMQSSTPFLKLPLDLMSGVDWGTGKPIKDVSEHVDKTIPQFDYLGGVLGISPSGTIAGGKPDVRSAVKYGYQTGLFNEDGSFNPGGAGETQVMKLLNWAGGQAAVKLDTKDEAEAKSTARSEAYKQRMIESGEWEDYDSYGGYDGYWGYGPYMSPEQRSWAESLDAGGSVADFPQGDRPYDLTESQIANVQRYIPGWRPPLQQ